ncbi:MAG: metalloprotease, partial [Saprospiraceae bacterium]|nr:metalloprotease [Saprospiraceae bacterium]
LNEDYAATGIRFYFKDDWNLINSTAWYQHANIPQGIDMMLTNNVPDALNAYFASNVAGNCGYNLPYAGVAVAHNCAATGDHTWAHEVGHALSLPHPFIGWEG